MRLRDCSTRPSCPSRRRPKDTTPDRPAGRIWGRGLALALGVALGACAYHGNFDDPIQRRFQWFSFIGGEDIQDACHPGSVDRYRFVYNGRYSEQLRDYELVGDGAGGAYLTSRATGGYANLATVSLNDPLGPWRWQESRTQLNSAQFKLFIQALAADGFLQPPKTAGRRFSSNNFYWLVSGCHDGQFHFGAWIWPSDDFAALKFPALLLARDQTGMAFNQPYDAPGGETMGQPGVSLGANAPFNITIHDDGLGRGSLF
jgi:hypothetical protein